MNYNSDDEIVELFYSVAKISRYTPEGVRGLPAFIGQYRRLRLLDEMGTARQSALADSMDIRPSSLPHHIRSYRLGGIFRDYDRGGGRFRFRLRAECTDARSERNVPRHVGCYGYPRIDRRLSGRR